jgi:hypothetical protein
MPMKTPTVLIEIDNYHDNLLKAEPKYTWENFQTPNSLEDWCEFNHNMNTLLWSEEDLARRTKATDGEIAVNKRKIDKLNQARNDAVEKIDEILADIFHVQQYDTAIPLHSETPGMMLDRLSILALKIRSMKDNANNQKKSTSHQKSSKEKLLILIRQRDDLKKCLFDLLNDCHTQCKRFVIYRQFKMYNDPAYNPNIA